MRCLDASERDLLLDALLEGGLVHVVYARVDPKSHSIYCTIQPRKAHHGNYSGKADPARLTHDHVGNLFTE